MSSEPAHTGRILIYQNEKGDTKIDVYFVWMTQRSMAELYQVTPQNITTHIKHIYEDGELDQGATCKSYLQVQMEGNRQIRRDTKFYNLDMILAVGYRVRSNVGVHFRRWASGILTEYMKKGFALNDERLRNPKEFGADYFDELLERIRDIRASEISSRCRTSWNMRQRDTRRRNSLPGAPTPQRTTWDLLLLKGRKCAGAM